MLHPMNKLSIMLLQLNNDVTTLLTTCSYRVAAHASVFTPVNINREQVVRFYERKLGFLLSVFQFYSIYCMYFCVVVGCWYINCDF